MAFSRSRFTLAVVLGTKSSCQLPIDFAFFSFAAIAILGLPLRNAFFYIFS
jgi:hypothetical protein